MMKKRLAILGSTGSIGTTTLSLVRDFPHLFEVTALTAAKNVQRLADQVEQFHPKQVAVCEDADFAALRAFCPTVQIDRGEDAICACATREDVDIVVVGIVGFAALKPTLAAVRAGKTVALANKEVLVAAGPLLKKELAQSKALLIPVDSEHNALFQVLQGHHRDEISTLVLTASGGPLFRRPDFPLEDVTPAVAVKHPNWLMGPKVSVDSATLMNKGLELIEAHYLFDVPENQIDVWIHPQSLLHGAVWLKDNVLLAQVCVPDMRSSIGFALAYPDRLTNPIDRLKWSQLAQWEFHEPDLTRFPALRLAREALRSGPSHLIVLNAANEIAVQAFLEGRILFPQITSVVEKALQRHTAVGIESLKDVFDLDLLTRRQVQDSLSV